MHVRNGFVRTECTERVAAPGARCPLPPTRCAARSARSCTSAACYSHISQHSACATGAWLASLRVYKPTVLPRVPLCVTPERQRAPHHRPPLSPATQALPKRFAHALGPLRALYRSPASAGRTPRPLGQHPRLGRHHRQPRLSNGVSAAALRAHFRSLSYRVPSRTGGTRIRNGLRSIHSE